jgi:NTP pyrophosphatase (non-canonical NTP hydrolase)
MNDKTTTIENLKEEINKFVEERKWNEFQNMRSLAISLSLEANELLDHFQWLNDKEVDNYENNEQNKLELGEELVDILSYILIASNKLDIDITGIFRKKLEKNREKYPAQEFIKLNRTEDNKKYQEKRKEWEKKSS